VCDLVDGVGLKEKLDRGSRFEEIVLVELLIAVRVKY